MKKASSLGESLVHWTSKLYFTNEFPLAQPRGT